jgi:DNA replication regulator SLD3
MTDSCSYGARLPSLSNMLCQKFGGPKQHSPARPPLVKAATCGAPLRPGTTLHRQPMQKSRRTLERVLTDERLASRRPAPSLSRSATDPVLPGLKRESSIVSLYSIPPTKVDLQKSRRYSQREVDLSAMTQAHETKLKKKAKVEEELQGAITALKKPNPRMAGKEFVEAAERRVAASILRSKLHLGIRCQILTIFRTQNPPQKPIRPRRPSHGDA